MGPVEAERARGDCGNSDSSQSEPDSRGEEDCAERGSAADEGTGELCSDEVEASESDLGRFLAFPELTCSQELQRQGLGPTKNPVRLAP